MDMNSKQPGEQLQQTTQDLQAPLPPRTPILWLAYCSSARPVHPTRHRRARSDAIGRIAKAVVG